MDRRYRVALSGVLALIALRPVAATGQETGWTPPRTPWGDPDLYRTRFPGHTFVLCRLA